MPSTVATILVVVGGVLAASFRQAPSCRATAQVLISPRTPTAVLPNQGATDAVSLDREISIFESRAVQEEIRERLGHPATCARWRRAKRASSRSVPRARPRSGQHVTPAAAGDSTS